MKQALMIAAVFAALVALAALPGATSVVRSLPATNADDPAGVAYTENLRLGRYWRHTGSHNTPHAETDAVTGRIHVDVRGAVAKLRLTGGTWNASLNCPAPVAKDGVETFERSGLALSAAASFAVRMVTTAQTGLLDAEYRCWLRVTIGLTEDGETITLRDAMLPVRVTLAQATI